MIFSQATAVGVNRQGILKGILIRGEPSSGKSTLALRLIARNATLIADDCLYLENRNNNSLWAHHIARIGGKLAVRKVGILTFKNLPFANIRLVVDLCLKNGTSVANRANGKSRASEKNGASEANGKNGASKGGSNETTICGVVLPRLQTELDETTPLRVESALL